MAPFAEFPFSERAVAQHSDRFAYLVRIDVKDPEVERIVGEVRQNPGALYMRIVPIPDTGEVASLERGEFEPLFAAAGRTQSPKPTGASASFWVPFPAH